MGRFVLAVFILISLSGCGALLGAAAESAALEGAAAAGEIGAAEGGLTAVRTLAEMSPGVRTAVLADAGAGARVGVSGDIVQMAADRGIISNALDRITVNGTQAARITLTRSGWVEAQGRVLGRIEPGTGLIRTPNGTLAGYLDGNIGRIFEYMRGGGARPVGELRGFTSQSGVQLRSFDGGTQIRVLKSNAYVRVLKIDNGRYLVRPIDGEAGWVDSGLIELFVLRVRLETQGWAFRRSRLPPMATRMMASETSIRAS